MLESAYQVFALAILGTVFGGTLVFRHRRELLAVAPKLVVVAAVCAGFALWLYGPYLDTRDAWGVLEGRGGGLQPPSTYLPGRSGSVGLLGLLLAALGLVDRFRKARPVGRLDPRLPLVVGGLLVLASTTYGVPVPGVGLTIPNPLMVLRDWLPGVAALRVLSTLRFGVLLVVALLAAYGVHLVREQVGSWGRVAAACLAGLALFECLVPSVARSVYAHDPRLVSVPARPSPDTIALLRRAGGPVAHYPADGPTGLPLTATRVFLGAYHGHPVSSCYNSFSTLVQDDVDLLVRKLPSPEAADALHAIGFRAIAVDFLTGDDRARLRLRPLLDDAVRIRPLGETDDLALYELRGGGTVRTDTELLAAQHLLGSVQRASGPRSPIEFVFRNGTDFVYRPEGPPRPKEMTVRWHLRDRTGGVTREDRVSVALPTALGPGMRTLRRVDLPLPPPGRYLVALHADDSPDPVTLRRVDVEGAR
jgi:hypothetical protein